MVTFFVQPPRTEAAVSGKTSGVRTRSVAPRTRKKRTLLETVLIKLARLGK